MPTFQTGGFALSLGTFQIEQDSSPTQIFGSGRRWTRNGNPVAGKVGDANPDFQMSFSSDVDFHRFTLGFLFDWKQGGDIINLTEFLYDAGQNSKDYLIRGRRGTHRAFGAGVHRAVRAERHLRQAAGAEPVLQPARADPSRASSDAASARRGSRSPGGTCCASPAIAGLDPEVSNFGNQAIVRNIDVAPFPPSRSFFFSIDLGF